jgi:hypothetical protein
MSENCVRVLTSNAPRPAGGICVISHIAAFAPLHSK